MPVRMKDSVEEVVVNENIEDDSDEEIISVKKNKASCIKSDESEEEDDTSHVIHKSSEKNCAKHSEIENVDETSEDVVHSVGRISTQDVLKSQDEVPSVDECVTSHVHSSSKTSGDRRRDFKLMFANKDLYDPEDSDDDHHHPNSDGNPHPEKSNDNYDAEGSSDECSNERRVVEMKSKSIKARKSSKKTESKKEVDEIHSETQRLVRQSRVSLPYHKPRQRTLAEFLQRRPAVPAKSLRMSNDELKLLAKQVAKRAKETEEFYKSSSDEEISVRPERTYEINVNENASSVREICRDSNKNDELLENEPTSKRTENTNIKHNELELRTEENFIKENSFIMNTIVFPSGITEHAKKNSTDAVTAEWDLPGIDSQDLHLKIEETETFDTIPKSDKELQVQTVNSHSYLMEDTQSAMDSEKVSAVNEKSRSVISNMKIPFCDDEIDSQDICLRIEDTETFGEITAGTKDTPIVEQCFSESFKEIINSEGSEQLSTIGSKNISLKNPIKNESKHIKEIDSQHLCIRINDPFGTVVNEKREKNTDMFSEGKPQILPTKEYEKSAFKYEHISSESPCNQEVDSQDTLLRIENSEPLNANDSETVVQSEVEIRPIKIDKNVLINKDDKKFMTQGDKCDSLNSSSKILMIASNDSESQNLSLHSTETNTCDLLENSNGNCKTMVNMHSKGRSMPSSQRNLAEIFSGIESRTKDRCNDISLHDSKEDSIAGNRDNLKLILEGEETRVAFEQYDSCLDKRTTPNIDKSEEFRSSYNTPTMLNSESENSISLLKLGKTDEKSEQENTGNMSKQSHDIELCMKDFGLDSKENAIKTIQMLMGSDNSDSNNAKFLRTMSLLEDRLKSTRKSLKLQNSVPQLKGSPSKVIDLDDTPSSNDINVLKERFFRHSFPKTPAPQKPNVEVSVISAEAGPSGELEVKKEVVSVPTEAENLIGTRAKLRRLKEDLQKQIVKEREEEWNRRQLEMTEANSLVEADEKSDCGIFDEDEEGILESDHGSENDDEEEELDSDEEEEDEMTEKQTKHKMKKSSCAFVDDEAEVSDDDDDDDDIAMSDHADDSEPIKAFVLGADEASETDTLHMSLKRMKTLDPFESQEVSSDITCEKEQCAALKNVKNNASLSQSGSDVDDVELDSSLSIPPYQLGGAVSQIMDPVGEEPYLNIIPPTIPTPLAKEDTDSDNIFSQFPESSVSFGLPNSLNETDNDEAELLGLCSGKFTSQPPDVSQDEAMYLTGDLGSVLPYRKKCEEPKESAETILQSSSAQNIMKEKFSEVTKSESLSQEKVIKESGESPSHTRGRRKFVVVSSDEEDETDNKVSKKSHQLTFSDDDDNDDDTNNDDGKVNSCGKPAIDDENEPLDVEYDSEENEVPVKTSAREFFENEAELSESEWGSADEDEKGLDDFEIEEGDDEKLDQTKVKEQLDRIHMRRVLDEDQQEVRRLQELLLEDGEFHSESGGRQRQFRWKNLNNTDDLQLSRKSDNEASGGEDDEDDESQWRRKRFERETFLLEHKNSVEKDEELLHDALRLKFKTPVQTMKKNVQVKRGSFLARSEAALARIAQLTKNTAEVAVLAPANSRNFVFATLSQDPSDNDKGLKRKASNTETPIVKKFRVSTNLLDQIG